MMKVSPEELYSRYEQVLRGVSYLTAVLLLALTVIVLGNIVLRPFGESPRWATHAAQALVIWITFLGLALLAYEREHLAVDILADRYLEEYKPQREKFELAVNLIFVVATLYAAIDLTDRTFGSTTATGVPTAFIYLPLVISSVLLALVYIGQLAGFAGDLDD